MKRLRKNINAAVMVDNIVNLPAEVIIDLLSQVRELQDKQISINKLSDGSMKLCIDNDSYIVSDELV